ncbi:hypothetical protein Tco_0339754 [Tanacetum coccineum]
MGEPLSPDRIFDFSMDEPHPAYDFFAPAPLPEYAGNLNNNNGWLAADDYLLGELEVMVDEQMVVADDASDGFGEEEVWEVNEDWLIAPTTPPPVLAMPPPSIYEVGGPSTVVAEGPSFPQVAPGLLVPPSVIDGLSTRLDNLEYGHGQLVQRVIYGSDAEISAGVIIGEIGPRVLAIEGQMQVMVSQMIQVVDRVEQVGVQVELGQQTSTQRDEIVTGLTQQVQALQADV